MPELLWHPEPSAETIAERVAAVIGEPAVVGGYDVGSRVAQALARARPELVRALVLAPPLPGVGERVLSADAHREFWYQAFHRLELAEQLDRRQAGRGPRLPAALLGPLVRPGVRAAGGSPRAARRPLRRARRLHGVDRLVPLRLGRRGQEPGRDRARERIAAPTHVLWPEHEPLFPRAWGDRLDEFFADVVVTDLPGAGHFSPLEAPEAWAEAIRAHL